MDAETKAPTLFELKTRQCTLDELQAALVLLIELHNEQGRLMDLAMSNKHDRPFVTTL